MTHYVQCREIGKKRWAFLSRDGVTRLKIHALRFTEDQANKLIEENAPDNPEWEFQVIKIGE